MPATHACLWFNTQAEEAARFYTQVFPNSAITSIAHWPEDSGPRSGTVLTVDFHLDSQRYVALNGGPEFRFSEAVSFVISCQDQAEIDYFWDALIAGGGAPSECGWLRDRFGLSWQVVPASLDDLMADPAAAARVMPVLLKMSKLIVADLEAAARG